MVNNYNCPPQQFPLNLRSVADVTKLSGNVDYKNRTITYNVPTFPSKHLVFYDYNHILYTFNVIYHICTVCSNKNETYRPVQSYLAGGKIKPVFQIKSYPTETQTCVHLRVRHTLHTPRCDLPGEAKVQQST